MSPCTEYHMTLWMTVSVCSVVWEVAASVQLQISRHVALPLQLLSSWGSSRRFLPSSHSKINSGVTTSCRVFSLPRSCSMGGSLSHLVSHAFPLVPDGHICKSNGVCVQRLGQSKRKSSICLFFLLVGKENLANSMPRAKLYTLHLSR